MIVNYDDNSNSKTDAYNSTRKAVSLTVDVSEFDTLFADRPYWDGEDFWGNWSSYEYGVKWHLNAGNKISAIKQFRVLTGCGLYDSKMLVEAYMAFSDKAKADAEEAQKKADKDALNMALSKIRDTFASGDNTVNFTSNEMFQLLKEVK